jgi:hypothetical protein
VSHRKFRTRHFLKGGIFVPLQVGRAFFLLLEKGMPELIPAPVRFAVFGGGKKTPFQMARQAGHEIMV